MINPWWIVALAVVTFGLGFLSSWERLDGIDWLLLPVLAFGAMLVLMRMTGKPVTPPWIGASAVMAVLIGLFLRFF